MLHVQHAAVQPSSDLCYFLAICNSLIHIFTFITATIAIGCHVMQSAFQASSIKHVNICIWHAQAAPY